MAANVGPSDAERYDWRNVAQQAIAPSAMGIARRLARTGARAIGFLPMDDALDPPQRLAPLLARIGEAMASFTGADSMLVDAWQTWPWGQALQAGNSDLRVRTIGVGLREVAPPPCGDPAAAATTLQHVLTALRVGSGSILVNLAGYAEPGVPPPAIAALDGVVLIVSARRSRKPALSAIARKVPPKKNLGALLLG